MNLPLWLILVCVVLAVVLGYGWAWLEVVVSSRLGWVIVVAVVLLAVALTRNPSAG